MHPSTLLKPTFAPQARSQLMPYMLNPTLQHASHAAQSTYPGLPFSPQVHLPWSAQLSNRAHGPVGLSERHSLALPQPAYCHVRKGESQAAVLSLMTTVVIRGVSYWVGLGWDCRLRP